jgi:hypothetical protein
MKYNIGETTMRNTPKVNPKTTFTDTAKHPKFTVHPDAAKMDWMPEERDSVVSYMYPSYRLKTTNSSPEQKGANRRAKL